MLMPYSDDIEVCFTAGYLNDSSGNINHSLPLLVQHRLNKDCDTWNTIMTNAQEVSNSKLFDS